MLKPKPSVFGILGMKTPQQVAAEEFQKRFSVQMPRDPYQKLGRGLGELAVTLFGKESPEVERARKREEIGGGILSQYYEDQKAVDQQLEADQAMDDFGFSPDLELTANQREQLRALDEADMYSKMAERYTSEGMIPEAEQARKLVQASMSRAMDIQSAILDAEAKTQQIAASKQQVSASQQTQRRAEQQETERQTTRAQLLEVAGNENALIQIGFDPKLAKRIAGSPNKEAYLTSIQKRLETPEEGRKVQAEKERRDLRTKLQNVAGNKEALVDIGFGEKLATRIAGSPNKEVYFEAIQAKLKAKGEDTGDGDGLSTDQKNQNTLMKLIKDRRTAMAQGDNDKAEMLGIEINSFSGILGLNSAKFEGVVVDSLDKTQKASELDIRSSDLIARIESSKDDMKSGVPARVDEAMKAVFGDQDRFTVLQAQYASIRNSSVLQYLPPGVASDRDVALVLEGTIDRYSSPEAMMSFLRGVQKIAAAEKKYHEARLDYLSNPEVFGNPVGFQKQWRNDQYDARVDALRQIGYEEDKAVEYADTPLSFSRAVQAKRGDSRKTLEELKKRRELIR